LLAIEIDFQSSLKIKACNQFRFSKQAFSASLISNSLNKLYLLRFNCYNSLFVSNLFTDFYNCGTTVAATRRAGFLAINYLRINIFFFFFLIQRAPKTRLRVGAVSNR
jgi:hypothetical protein